MTSVRTEADILPGKNALTKYLIKQQPKGQKKEEQEKYLLIGGIQK